MFFGKHRLPNCARKQAIGKQRAQSDKTKGREAEGP